MIRRDDLMGPDAGPETAVWQLTDDDVPSCHVYMEAQIFTLDSERFVLHRSAHPHGSDRHDPEHRYLLCDLTDSCRMTPITDELGATGPSISPDGQFFYYGVDRTECGAGSFTLRRVRLDGTERCDIACLDGPVDGMPAGPSKIYPLSTISSDGKRLAISAFFGDGSIDDAPFGLMVFDLQSGEVRVVVAGPDWCNLHPQYCRATDPEQSHDLLIQHNHGCVVDRRGQVSRLTGGNGADIHVIRDDGSDFRTMPWGRDGDEFCQGHQCWRGRGAWAVTSTSTRSVGEAQLIEGQACADVGHAGRQSPGGHRQDLSARVTAPQFFHFSTDLAGRRLVSDYRFSDPDGGDAVMLLELSDPGRAPAHTVRSLARPGSSWAKGAHVHPFLSPDGRTAFFNSDESGSLQAYMISGLPEPTHEEGP